MNSIGVNKTDQNEAERKQHNAAAISQKHYQYLKTHNQQSKDLAMEKYLSILLGYPGVVNEDFTRALL